MNYDEMNDFLERYVKEDISGTAVLLSGGWGTGKSFYVKNELKSFLKKRKIGSIILSLYGLSEVSQIYKYLYFELRMKTFEGKKNEIFTTGRAILKGATNSLLGIADINFDISDDELKKIYQSVNLKNKLVVLEDLERTSIPIDEVLGLVNELTENNNVKVLLVANEDYILKEISDDLSEEKITNSKYTEIKEKTIGDTISLSQPLNSTILEILSKYDSGILSDLINNDDSLVEYLKTIVINNYSANLRTFKYAIQKAVDIFNKYGEYGEAKDKRLDFYRQIFEQILVVVGEYKKVKDNSNGIIGEINNRAIDSKPNTTLIYDYIFNKVPLNKEKILESYAKYDEYMIYKNKIINDKDMRVLDTYYIQTEESVLNALKSIENKLSDRKAFSLYAYERLAIYMTEVANIVDFDSSVAVKRMIENVKGIGVGKTIDLNEYFPKTYTKNSSIGNDCKELINDLKCSINSGGTTTSFSYDAKDIVSLMSKEYRYPGMISNNQKVFISKYDVKKLFNMLNVSSPEDIDIFREVLFSYYRDTYKDEYVEEDIKSLRELQILLQKKLNENNSWDKIKILQIDWLIQNIQEIIRSSNKEHNNIMSELDL